MSNKDSTATQHTEYEPGVSHHHDYKVGTHGISRIQTSDSHIHIGDMKFERQEFNRAFEGYLNPGYSPAPSRRFANPVPIGVAGFSLTLFVLSLVNIGARGASNPAALAGLMWFYAGAIELLAGMWCIVVEATWAAVLLSSFAGFWISYGCIVIDVFGVATAYGENTHNLLGLWLLGWTFFATMMWLMTLKSTWPLCVLMLFVVLTLLCLCIAQFISVSAPTGSLHMPRAGGYCGLFTSLLGWFVMYEGICSKENSIWVPPVLLMPGAVTKKED